VYLQRAGTRIASKQHVTVAHRHDIWQAGNGPCMSVLTEAVTLHCLV
jgi:hypothetical protein